MRMYELDFCRSIAILWIIAVWHVVGYTAAGDIITVVMLGVLVFISGFALSKSNIVTTLSDTLMFYRKRLIRVYPLYLFALTLFYVSSLLDGRSGLVILSNIFALNMFLNNSIFTLWFVSMIMVMYALYPLFTYKYSNFRALAYLVTIELLLCIVKYKFRGLIDIRMIIYLPVFVTGLFLARNKSIFDLLKEKTSVILLSIIFIFVSGLYIHFNASQIKYPLRVAIILTSVPILMVIGTQITSLPFARRISLDFAYASFCMYLLHRVVHAGVHYVSDSIYSNGMLLNLVSLPVLYIASRFIQSGYDSIAVKLRHRDA